MRVLHVVTLVDDESSSGDALRVAVNHCIELRRRGHDARIAGGWGGRGSAPTHLEGVPVHLFPVHPIAPRLGLSGLFSPRLLRWARRNASSLDVAHLHLARDLVPLSIAGVLQRLGVPYVVQTHGELGPDTGPLSRLLDRRVVRRTLLSARHAFAATVDERDAIARVSGTAENISLLPGGVVLPDRVPVTRGDGPADVLFLGRLQPNRRALSFAAAADRLAADGLDATFSIVGPDGGDLRELRSFLAARPHLQGRLRYEGVLPHERAVERLRRADLYVLPSVGGPAYPMSLLEAMAAGVPSIVTTECELAGTLAREHAAIVANPTDDALYGAMRRLLTDRAARARLSAQAAAAAAAVFSMAPVAEQLEQEYARAGSTGHRAGGRERRADVLWVVSAPTPAHADVWDALGSVTALTAVVLPTRHAPAVEPPGPDASPTGEPGGGEGAGEAGLSAVHLTLSGRGYPVLEVPARAGRAPAAVRAMLRDRPRLMVLEGGAARAQATMLRWAQRAGVPVVTAAPGSGPVEAARAAVSALAAGGGSVELDLRGTPSDTGSGADPAARSTVIDLEQSRPRTSGRHHR